MSETPIMESPTLQLDPEGTNEGAGRRTRIIEPSSAEWPPLLREADGLEPPERLFLRGRDVTWDKPVAVVGTRRPSPAGVQAARQIARGLAQAGFTVVSGLAIGIDAVAHRAALDAGGTTVAIVGAGLDNPYPARNERVRRDIEAAGTIVSEYPDGSPVHPANFPARNRLIAGSSLAVVVVEGAAGSGALITARHALDASRSIFAVPGSIRNPMAEGPNELIRTSAAALITDVQHIFDDLAPGLVWADPIGVRMEKGRPALEEAEVSVLFAFEDQPLATHQVMAHCALVEGRVQLILSRLQVRGLVVKRRRGWELTEVGAKVRAMVPIPGLE